MSVGVLLVTHPGVGSSLLHIATRIIGSSTLPVKCLEVPPGSPLEPVRERARSMLKVLNRGTGVLVLTDITERQRLQQQLAQSGFDITIRVVPRIASGVSDMLSIPCSTRNCANSG